MDEQILSDRLGKLCMHNVICIETINTETFGCQADAFQQIVLFEDSGPDLTACLSG